MNIFSIISVLVIFLLSNYYVALRLYQLAPHNTLFRIALIIILIVCIGSLFLFFPFYKKMPYIVSASSYRIGTAWIIAFAYFLLLFLIVDLIKLSNVIFSFTSRSVIHSLTHDNIKSFLVLVGIVVLLLVVGNINYHNKRRVYHKITTEKLQNNQKIRVVAISDLHLGYTIGSHELKRWVKMINKENPDIVVISGDLIDNNVQVVDDMDLDKIIRNINAPLGVYGCLGNHEYISGLDESISFYHKSDIILLRDESVEVVNNFTLIGRDDVSNSERQSLSTIMADINDNDFKLLLDHQPRNLEESEKAKIDLQISGHTHNGQVFPFSIVAESIFEIAHGMLQKGLTKIYVTSGLGIWGGKFRIGTQSEYAVFDIVNN